MTIGVAWLLAMGPLLAAALPHPQDQPPAGPRLSWSWADSDSLKRKLEAVTKRPSGARSETIVVTEAELNSYVNLGQASRLPPGVSDVTLKISGGRIEAKALVDLERVRGLVPSDGSLKSVGFLAGRVPVEARGRLMSSDGFGTLDPEEVRLGGFAIPVSALQQGILQVTRSAQNPQGFDILAPFRLPFSLKRVRLRPGKALLDF